MDIEIHRLDNYANLDDPMQKKTLSILFVTRSLPFHQVGGMEVVTWDLARSLSKRGHHVAIMTTRSDKLASESTTDGVRICTVDAPPGRYSMKWWINSRRRYLTEFQDSTDIVLSVSAGALALPSSKAGPVLLAQIHGVAWGEILSKLRQRNVVAVLKSIRNFGWLIRDFRFRMFRGFIAVGDAVARDIKQLPTRAILGPRPLKIIANGIDQDHFAFEKSGRIELRREHGIDALAKVIISASRLHAQKGVSESLEGFAVASRVDPSLRYVIIGTGPEELRLKARARDLEIDKLVHFVGEVDRKVLPRWLSLADIFIFTSKRVEAGATISMLEAMSSGLPIVASAGITNDLQGVLAVNPDDPNDIANAINRTVLSTERSSKLPTEKTIEFTASQYLNLFFEYAQARGNPPHE